MSGTERVRGDRGGREKAARDDHSDEGKDDGAAAGHRAFGHDRAGFLGLGANVVWTLGPLSVRRAWTQDEMAGLLRDAGLRPVATVVGFAGHRYAIAAR